MAVDEFRNGFTAGDLRKAAAAKCEDFQERRDSIKAIVEQASSAMGHEPTEDSYVGGSGYTYTTDGPSEFETFEASFAKVIQWMDKREARMRQITDAIAGYRDETPLILTDDDYELIFGKEERTES